LNFLRVAAPEVMVTMQPGYIDNKKNIPGGFFNPGLFFLICAGFFFITAIVVPAAAAAPTAPISTVASFTGTPTSGSAPCTVQFTDTSLNFPTSWLWDFGDGNTSTAQNPVHTYPVAGDYTVSLTAASTTGGSNTAIRARYITVNNAPSASFYVSVTSGTAPFIVQFTDTSTNSPTSWSWNFGDNRMSDEQNPTHSYTKPGTYSVSLTVRNPAGIDQSIQSDYIMVSTTPVARGTQTTARLTPVPSFPVVSFSGTPTSGNAPLTVQFTAMTSATPASYSWDFGDGGTSTERNPSYTYVIPGTYTVILTAHYPAGSKPVRKSSYITVNGGPGPVSSPVSPLVPLGAIGIIAMVSYRLSGPKRH
jgi:PKD repeat protein